MSGKPRDQRNINKINLIYIIFDMTIINVISQGLSIVHSVMIGIHKVISGWGKLYPKSEDAERAGALRKFWSNQKTVELSNPHS
jgi:hypothetical protein